MIILMFFALMPRIIQPCVASPLTTEGNSPLTQSFLFMNRIQNGASYFSQLFLNQKVIKWCNVNSSV